MPSTRKCACASRAAPRCQASSALARRFFSPAERDRLRQLPESARREAFFACWAAKEAVLKATGEGLSAGLGRFDMVVLADRPAGRQVIRDGGGMDHPWSVTSDDESGGLLRHESLNTVPTEPVRQYH